MRSEMCAWSAHLIVAAELRLQLIGVYYRAMHFSAKRGIAIACRLSVCDVGGPQEILETNCTDN